MRLAFKLSRTLHVQAHAAHGNRIGAELVGDDPDRDRLFATAADRQRSLNEQAAGCERRRTP